MDIPGVVQAVPGDDFTVHTYFSDGAIKLADIQPLIARGGVFAQLSDERLFQSSLTVLNETVVWDIAGNRDEFSCIDIDPVTVYETATDVPDPLGSVA